MARTRNLRLWGVALWAVCLLASTTGPLGNATEPPAASILPAAVRAMSQAPDAAVLPARIADDVRAAGHAGPSRVLVLAAVLAVLVGLPGVLRRPAATGGHGTQPLRARRHTITLRAPPLQFA